MKWQKMSKEETGDGELCYIDTGDFDRVVEVMCKKKGFEVRFYRNDKMEFEGTYLTLVSAKKSCERWLTKEIDRTIASLKKLKEKS